MSEVKTRFCIEDICSELKRIYDSNYRKVHDSLKENLRDFSYSLIECGLITNSANQLNYDEIIRQVFAGFSISEDIHDLERACQNFLSSFARFGHQQATLARETRRLWNLKCSEIGVSTTFLSVELAKHEQIDLLRSVDVRPPEAHRQTHRPFMQKHMHFQDAFDDKNDAYMLFECHYNTIVGILCREGLIMPVGTRLCEVGLLSIATVHQAEKMSCDLIKAKTIVGSVATVLRRGFVPTYLLEKFLGVLQMDEFQQRFTQIIADLRKKGYKDIDVDGVIAKQKQYYNRFKSMLLKLLLQEFHYQMIHIAGIFFFSIKS